MMVSGRHRNAALTRCEHLRPKPPISPPPALPPVGLGLDCRLVRRRLFNLVAGMLLVLCLTTLVIWVRSYETTDSFERYSSRYTHSTRTLFLETSAVFMPS